MKYDIFETSNECAVENKKICLEIEYVIWKRICVVRHKDKAHREKNNKRENPSFNRLIQQDFYLFFSFVCAFFTTKHLQKIDLIERAFLAIF